MAGKGNSIGDIIHSLPGGPYYTTADVAKLLNRSHDAVADWRKNPNRPQPSIIVQVGGLPVYLYTPKDVQRLKASLGKRVTK